MVLITQSGPDTLPIGSPAPDFNLPGTYGQSYSLASFADSRAVVLAFTCNHCPYAQAYEGRFKSLVDQYASQGAAFAAINPNDAEHYPDDSFLNMKKRAKAEGFNFPYLRDDDQSVAKAYGAVCTPHYFVLNGERKIVYEGRLDDNWQEPSAATTTDLADAMTAVLAGDPVSTPNTGPMGCSIKWK